MRQLLRKLGTGIGYTIGWLGLGLLVLVSMAFGLLQCAFLPFSLPAMLAIGLFLPVVGVVLLVVFGTLAVLIERLSAPFRPKRKPTPETTFESLLDDEEPGVLEAAD